MKLFFHFILIFISVLVISCKKDDPVDPVIPADPNETLMDTVQMQIFKFFWSNISYNLC